MKFSLTHKILLVVAIPLLIQFAFLGLMSRSLNTLAVLENEEQKHVKVLMAHDRLLISSRIRQLLFAIYLATVDPSCSSRYFEVRTELTRVFTELADLWADSPVRLKKLRKLEADVNLTSERTHIMFQHPIERKERLSDMMGPPMHQMFLERMMLTNWLPYVKDAFAEEEVEKQQSEKTLQQCHHSLGLEILFGFIAVLVASLLSGLLFSYSVSRRLKTVLLNIDTLAGGRSTLQSIRGNDEISQLNTAVVTSATKIREAEEFQAQTAAIIADELNQPLKELDAALQELSQVGFEELSEKGAKRLKDTGAEIKRLESLVFELVNLNSSNAQTQVAELDLMVVVQNCVRIVEPLTKLKEISVSIECDENMVALANGEKITQVLINLLSNAIKYSPDKSSIEVRVEAVGLAEKKVSVTDHGSGIPEHFRKNIFKRFEQAESASSQKSASSGLGLKISKEIIEAQGGNMDFLSIPGESTTFWFTLPATAEVNSRAEQLSTSPPNSADLQRRSSHAAAMRWKPTLWKKVLLIVALPMVVQIVTSLMLLNFLQVNTQKLTELQTIPKITALYSSLMNGIAKGAMLSMRYNVFRDEKDLIATRTTDEDMRKDLAELSKMKAVDKNADQLLTTLNSSIGAHIKLHEHMLQAPQDADSLAFVGANGSDRKERLWVNTHGPFVELLVEQAELIASNARELDNIRASFEYSLLASAIFAAVAASFVAIAIARGITKRAQQIAAAALRFSDSRELPQPPSGDDELAFVEKQLYAAASDLLELERVRAETIGLTSHELRTPLTSLTALIELMESGVFGVPTARGEKLLAKARLEATELIVLITNLLDLEKMESGKILVTKQKMDVENLLNQVKSENTLPADSKQIKLNVDNVSREIMADSNRLNQALTAMIRSILERVPRRSDVSVKCKTVKETLVISVAAPHGVAVKGYSDKQRQFARQEMAISLARLTAKQHGGDLNLVTSSKGRIIEMLLPIS